MLLISLLIILIETGPILSKLIMNTGPYDLALANVELKQMAAAEEDMRHDRDLVAERQKTIRSQRKERTDELLSQLTALQKKHIQEEFDQWERGEDKIPHRMPLEDVTRRIRQRYHFREDDVI
jgi:Ni/Co efflux regulator RcnB